MTSNTGTRSRRSAWIIKVALVAITAAAGLTFATGTAHARTESSVKVHSICGRAVVKHHHRHRKAACRPLVKESRGSIGPAAVPAPPVRVMLQPYPIYIPEATQ